MYGSGINTATTSDIMISTGLQNVYLLAPGTWSTPATTGTPPPPCVDFTFTMVDGHRAVLFGGYQPDTGTVADAYIIDMEKWVCDPPSYTDAYLCCACM